MSTQVTVTTSGEDCAIAYFQDGSTAKVPVNSTKSIQLVNNGFVTISEAADPDAAEHPEDEIPEFAQKMIEFWEKLLTGIPKATPQ